MKKQQLNEWVHQLVNESNVEVVKEIQLGEATVRLSKSTDANFHKQGGGMIVQLVSNVGSVGLDVKDVRALLGYIKKMMGYSYMPRLKEDYNNSEWEVYTKDEKGNEKVVKVAKSKRAATILYNKLIKTDKYFEVGMRAVMEGTITHTQSYPDEPYPGQVSIDAGAGEDEEYEEVDDDAKKTIVGLIAQEGSLTEWKKNLPGFSSKEYDVIQNWIDMGSLSQTIAMYKKNKKSFTQFIKDAARG